MMLFLCPQICTLRIQVSTITSRKCGASEFGTVGSKNANLFFQHQGINYNLRLVKTAAGAKCVHGAQLHDICVLDFQIWRFSTAGLAQAQRLH